MLLFGSSEARAVLRADKLKYPESAETESPELRRFGVETVAEITRCYLVYAEDAHRAREIWEESGERDGSWVDEDSEEVTSVYRMPE